jgi:Family of unknown function (DUF6308)
VPANGQVVLRNGLEIANPIALARRFLEAYSSYETGGASRTASFREPDLRLANRGGARISAAEIAAILERRGSIERALQAIAPDTSLTAPTRSLPWTPLGQLFAAFGDIRGVGFSKMTKALHPKRPALIPILDSVIQAYLKDEDLGIETPFGERALGLVRGYKRDVDRNRPALQTARRELGKHGYDLTEVRLLDILIWSVATEP